MRYVSEDMTLGVAGSTLQYLSDQQKPNLLYTTCLVTCYTFHHGCTTQLLESRYDIHTVQELFGPKDVNTTMIYTHVLNREGNGVKSLVDNLHMRNVHDMQKLYPPSQVLQMAESLEFIKLMWFGAIVSYGVIRGPKVL